MRCKQCNKWMFFSKEYCSKICVLLSYMDHIEKKATLTDRGGKWAGGPKMVKKKTKSKEKICPDEHLPSMWEGK